MGQFRTFATYAAYPADGDRGNGSVEGTPTCTSAAGPATILRLPDRVESSERSGTHLRRSRRLRPDDPGSRAPRATPVPRSPGRPECHADDEPPPWPRLDHRGRRRTAKGFGTPKSHAAAHADAVCRSREASGGPRGPVANEVVVSIAQEHREAVVHIHVQRDECAMRTCGPCWPWPLALNKRERNFLVQPLVRHVNSPPRRPSPDDTRDCSQDSVGAPGSGVPSSGGTAAEPDWRMLPWVSA